MARYCFGVDLGGTTAKIGLFTPEGEIIEKWEIPTVKEDNGSKILPNIAKAVTDKMAERGIDKVDVIGLGIGVPGPVDDDGFCNKAANLGWMGMVDLEGTLHQITGLHIKGGNDANVAALGEAWKGGAEGYSDVVMVTLGTGVGGGVIIKGKVVAGSTGAAGEIGHIHIQDGETKTCGCGNKGCLEQYASATGVVRLANEALEESNEPSVLRDQEVSAKSVFDAVKAGDKLAIEVAEKFGLYLGKGLAVIGCVTNPEVFVIGGGVSKAGDMLIPYIQKNYKEYTFHACRDAKFVLATLGNDAGMYGAAKLVLD